MKKALLSMFTLLLTSFCHADGPTLFLNENFLKEWQASPESKILMMDGTIMDPAYRMPTGEAPTLKLYTKSEDQKPAKECVFQQLDKCGIVPLTLANQVYEESFLLKQAKSFSGVKWYEIYTDAKNSNTMWVKDEQLENLQYKISTFGAEWLSSGVQVMPVNRELWKKQNILLEPKDDSAIVINASDGLLLFRGKIHGDWIAVDHKDPSCKTPVNPKCSLWYSETETKIQTTCPTGWIRWRNKEGKVINYIYPELCGED